MFGRDSGVLDSCLSCVLVWLRFGALLVFMVCSVGDFLGFVDFGCLWLL